MSRSVQRLLHQRTSSLRASLADDNLPPHLVLINLYWMAQSFQNMPKIGMIIAHIEERGDGHA